MLNSTFETDFHYGVTKVSTLVVMAVQIAMYVTVDDYRLLVYIWLFTSAY